MVEHLKETINCSDFIRSSIYRFMKSQYFIQHVRYRYMTNNCERIMRWYQSYYRQVLNRKILENNLTSVGDLP